MSIIKCLFVYDYDYIVYSTSMFFKHNRRNFHFENNKLVVLQETSGKHIDARQILPVTLNAFPSINDLCSPVKKILSYSELHTLFTLILSKITTTVENLDSIAVVENLILPCCLKPDFERLSELETNPASNDATRWIIDLILRMLNRSVVAPHFKSTNSRSSAVD